MKNCRKTFSLIMAVILTTTTLCTGCGEKVRATTMKLAQMEGSVGIRDEKKSLEPIPNMKLYSGYHVETGKAGYAWVDLDSVKLTKLDELSEIEVCQEGKKLEIHLESGSMFFHVTEPLKDDEIMEIRTSTMIVGIRGTCGWVDIPDVEHINVCILEGLVECQMSDPAVSEDNAVFVSSGQRVLIRFVDGQAEITLEQMKEADIPPFVMTELAEDLLNEIRPFLLQEENFEEEMEEVESESDEEIELETENEEIEPVTDNQPPEQTDDDTPSPFTNDQLRQIAADLHVPDNVIDKVEIIQYEPYYWDAAGIWLISIEITNPETGGVATASVDCATLELSRNIYMYTEE